MVSLLLKDSRCAHPPMTLCSTLVQPRNPKSTSRLPTSGEAAPPSLVRAKAASTTSRERRDSVATQVGYHTMVSSVSRKVHRGEYSPVAVICVGRAGEGRGAWGQGGGGGNRRGVCPRCPWVVAMAESGMNAFMHRSNLPLRWRLCCPPKPVCLGE